MYKPTSMFSKRKKVHDGLELCIELTLNSYCTTLYIIISHITVVAVSIQESMECILRQVAYKEKSNMNKFFKEYNPSDGRKMIFGAGTLEENVSGGLNESGLHSLLCFYTWSLVDRTV